MSPFIRALFFSTSLSAIAVSSAQAEGPKVTIGGNVVTQVGVTNQKKEFTDQNRTSDVSLRDTTNTHMRTDSRVVIEADGKSEAGIGYGGAVSLVGNASGKADEDFTQQSADKTYLYVENEKLGRAEAGTNAGASQSMKVGAANIARASGGISGDFYKFANLGGVVSGGSVSQEKFIITPDLPSVALPGARARAFSDADPSDADHTLSDAANKITYYTPRIMGLQAGVSYVPNLGEAGNATGFQGKYSGNGKAGYNRDVMTAGVNYEGKYENLIFKASAVAEHGGKAQKEESTDAETDGLKAYEFGANLGYAGLTLGGSWATIPEFGRTKSQRNHAGFWSLGVAYEFRAMGFSITYLNSRVSPNAVSGPTTNKFQNVSVGVDYKLAPGITPYIEASMFKMTDSDASTKDNQGSVVLMGTMLNF